MTKDSDERCCRIAPFGLLGALSSPRARVCFCWCYLFSLIDPNVPPYVSHSATVALAMVTFYCQLSQGPFTLALRVIIIYLSCQSPRSARCSSMCLANVVERRPDRGARASLCSPR